MCRKLFLPFTLSAFKRLLTSGLVDTSVVSKNMCRDGAAVCQQSSHDVNDIPPSIHSSIFNTLLFVHLGRRPDNLLKQIGSGWESNDPVSQVEVVKEES